MRLSKVMHHNYSSVIGEIDFLSGRIFHIKNSIASKLPARNQEERDTIKAVADQLEIVCSSMEIAFELLKRIPECSNVNFREVADDHAELIREVFKNTNNWEVSN